MEQKNAKTELIEQREDIELQIILSDDEQREITSLVKQEQISSKLTQLELPEVATFTQILMSVFNSLTSFLEMPDNVSRFISFLIGMTKPNSIIVEMPTNSIAARLGLSESSIKTYRRSTKKFMIDSRLALVDIEAIPNSSGTKTAYYRYTLHVLTWIHEIVKATLETGNAGVFSAFLYIQSFDDKAKDRSGKTKREKAFNELSQQTQKAIYEFQTLLELKVGKFAKRKVIIKEDKAAMGAAIQNLEKKIDAVIEEELIESLSQSIEKTNEIDAVITKIRNCEQALKIFQDELSETKEILTENSSIENLADKEIMFQQKAEGLKQARAEFKELINTQSIRKNEINITTKWRSAELLAKEYIETLEDVLKVEDVSESNLGYDLKVTYGNNKEKYVEVKKVNHFNEAFKLTNNEFSDANHYGDDYSVALVIIEPFQIKFISNPVRELDFTKVVERWAWKSANYKNNLQEDL